MTSSISEIERYFRQLARRRQWISLIAATYLRLGFPALLALAILYREELSDAFWPIIAATSLAQILSVLVRAATGKSEYAFFEYRDLEREHEELESRHEAERYRSRAAVYSVQALRYASQVVVDAMETANEGERENLEQLVREALFPVVEFRSELFGFTEERYNFAVYQHDPELNALHVLYRDVHRDIPRQDREWKPGFGHVGFCFIREEAVFSSDVRESEELSDDQSETDDDHYVSIAAAPIFALDEETNPRGVFVITSSAPDQFEKAIHRPFLIAIANVLALLFHIADE